MTEAQAYLEGASHALRDLLRHYHLPTPPGPLLVPALLATLLALVLGAALLLNFVLVSPRSARDAVLLLGPSPPAGVAPAPGKTVLFHALRTGRAPPLGTVPTQTPSDAAFAVSSAVSAGAEGGGVFARWVDFPGHARLRPALKDYLDAARGLVFVVDATPAVFAKTVRETAALLHDVLADAGVAKAATPVLVFCNKKDVSGAVAPADVRVRLEAEVERARKSKAATLAGAHNATIEGADAGEADKTVFLGYDDEAFNFDHVANDVRFATGSGKTLDVRAVEEFVAGLR